MKVAITLLVCCLAVTFADKPNEGSIEKDLDECKKELKVSEDDLSDPKKAGCFLVCMYKKQGYMREDSTFDIESIMNLNSDKPDKVKFRNFLEQTNEKCTKKAKGDACVLAKCFSDEPAN